MTRCSDSRSRYWRLSGSIGVLVLAISTTSLRGQVALAPPKAKQVEHISAWHGEKVNDPFYWLRDRSHRDTIKYLEAENAYTEEMTRYLRPFTDALYKEMLSHIKQTDLGVPIREGGYFYYSRLEEGKQYPIRCRKKAT